MLRNLIITLIYTITISLPVYAQKSPRYPVGDFINPMDIPLSLAGNFGELRSNHFHSGFDFRTNGEEGYIVKAVADGYISRIKVSAFGYGNALYITHKNGYVSVYGHLQRYDSIISNYVFKKQYELESFEVDLFPQKNEIVVTQGQIIALSGNTGGSEGPHLHFEIRDQKTEEIINPYFFGFAIEDTIAPSIEAVAIYPIEPSAHVDGHHKIKYIDVKRTGKDTYTLKEAISVSGKIGFGLITYDVENGSSNKNGTYAYRCKVDTHEVFKYTCNRFAFDQTRYINAHIDYGKMKKSKDRFQRCYLLPGNSIKQYETDAQRGIYEFNDTLYHTIFMEAFDFKNNKSRVEFTCKSKFSDVNLQATNTKNLFAYHKTNQFKNEDVRLEMPLNCLYDDVVFTYAKSPGTEKFLSDMHTLLNDEVPVHAAYTLSIKPRTKALKYSDKLLIVNVDEKGHPSSEGGVYENGYVVAKVRSFGNFAVMMDTTAPTIKLLNFDKEKLTFKKQKIELKIADNLSGIKSYSGSIDGKWVLLVHDNKEKTLTYLFDEKLAKTNGEHIFVISITDKKGNSKKMTTQFIY